MDFKINAAAGCSRGRIRHSNEDNLFFNGRILPELHDGIRHPVRKQFAADSEPFFCVCDGMGGEEKGETASYIAVSAALKCRTSDTLYLKNPGDFLRNYVDLANREVCDACDQLEEGRMGSTIVSLLFTADEVYCCNLGDSRAFRCRGNAWQQISRDHVELQPSGSRQKPALSQYLGVYPDELTLVPYIAKGGLKKDDIYLICSDGLTDMLSNIEIYTIIRESASIRRCVEKLIAAANDRGGKDNITVILCKVE